MASRRLFLVDGTALAYRSFFAFIRSPLTTSKGLNTSAVFGFTQALTRLMEAEPDAAIVVAWDAGGPTFRHRAYGAYKATREKMPDEMKGQLPYIEEVVRAYGLPFLATPGWEADDLIGTLAVKGAADGYRVAIVAGDKDFMQLVGERIALWIPKPGADFDKLGADGVKQKMGVPPERITDLLGLMGDASDNVPGVRGVGEKTAKDLLAQFGTLEAALDGAAAVKSKKLGEKLVTDREAALLSKRLVTIDCDAPVTLAEALATAGAPDRPRLQQIFTELEFKGMLRTVARAEEAPAARRGVVATGDDLRAVARELGSGKEWAFVVKAGHGTVIDGIAVALDAGNATFIPIDVPGGPADAFAVLAPLFADPRVPKGSHDAKQGMAALGRRGVVVEGLAFDTMLASYLIDPAQRQASLEDAALKFLGVKRGGGAAEGAVQQALPLLGAPAPMDRSAAATEDAILVMRLHHLFGPQLAALHVMDLYRELELPLVEVLLDMERRGVMVDVAKLRAMSHEYEARMAKLEEELHRLAGEKFNVNSPRQLGPILFEKLQIQRAGGPSRVKRTKTGYSTDADVLEQYAAHPIVATILEYRNLAKLRSTYLDALPSLVGADGRIHTSYNQAVAATGRLSSSDPNLQNIPIRTEEGRAIRGAFVAAPGCLLLSADYSQVELRILAHLTEDPGLIEVFRAGRDVHRETASRIFGVPADEVTLELRSRSKAINFGIVYGMGPQRLARETGLTLPEAKAFIESYFNTYPGVRHYIDRTLAKARHEGHVETLLGRRRDLPEIHSANGMLRSNAENAAINTPIQGSAADLIKKAMIGIHRRLQREGLAAAMLLQVHDELVLEVPEGELRRVMPLVRREMEEAIALSVPLSVDMGHGPTWLDAHG